jgi:hypothetical protein
MTQLEMDRENALVAEKHLVIKELVTYLHKEQFDRTTHVGEILRTLRDKINEMIICDF